MAYLIAWSIHTNGPCSAWSMSHLIADIQDLAMSFVSCNFSWISRCRNSTAHSAAKFSLASNGIMMGIHVPSNVPMESTSFKGMEFEANEIAYVFYNEYGRKTGFSIRKEYVNKCKKTGVVTSRRFVCAKEGVRGKDKRD